MAFDLLTTSALYAGLQSIGQFGTDHGLGGIAEGYSDRRACTLIGKLFSVLSPDPPPDALALLRMARQAHHDATLELLEQCRKDRTLDARLASTQRDQATLDRILAFVKERRRNLANEIPTPLPANVAALLNEQIDSTTRTRSLEQLMLEHFEAEIAPALNGDPIPQLLTKYLRQGWRVLGNDTRYHPRTWYSLISIHFLRAVHANPAPLHTQLLLNLAANQAPPPDLRPILDQLLLDEDAHHRRHAELLGILNQILASQAELIEGQDQLIEGQEELIAGQTRIEHKLDQALAGRPLTLDPERPLPTVHFIGREPELAHIGQALFQPADPHPILVCSVNGLAGIGKSYLCDEFAHRHRERFPGGYLRFPLDPQSPPRTAADLLAELADRLDLKVPAAQHAAAIRAQLKAWPALLHMENVDSDPVAREVAVFVRDLHGCSILISGRIDSLGQSQGWTTIPLSPFTRAQSLALLTAEFRAPRDPAEKAAFDRLADFLGDLPLAIHLAAGQLRAGLTIDEVIDLGLELAPADPTDPLYDQARGRLRSSFAISRELLLRSFPESERPLWRDRLDSFGFAPLCGVGPSLGAAICGCTEPELRRLMRAAQHLSLVTPLPDREHAWRAHTLLAFFLREHLPPSESDEATPFALMTSWFLERLPGDGVARRVILDESGALVAWLSEIPISLISTVQLVSHAFARECGPYQSWIALFQRGLASAPDPATESKLLWNLSTLKLLTNDPQGAEDLARRKRDLDQQRDEPRDAAVAAGLFANILFSRGDLDEALRIRQREELPVYEMLGDDFERAVTLGRIADIFAVRGDLDEALRIRQQETLPVFEALGEIRYRAITLGRIADILQIRGDLDEALRIRQYEEMPVYEKIGDIRSRAATLGQIASIYASRGDVDQAILILRQEVVPVFEKLGDWRSCAIFLRQVASIFNVRGDCDEASRILQQEVLPLQTKLGDVREKALTLSKLAEAFAERSNFDEAVRMLQEEVLPLYGSIDDRRSIAISKFNIAITYLERNHPGDLHRARPLLRDALVMAEEMRLPQATQIRALLKQLSGK